MYKVLFQNRADALSNRGGDTTQMLETREELIGLGLEIDISLEAEPDVSKYDIVHIFNIQTADYGIIQLRNAKAQNVPVVLSTIYWDMRHISPRKEIVEYHRSPIVRWLAESHWRAAFSLLILYKPYRINSFLRNYLHENLIKKLAAEMLQEADLLLPNSYAETEILAVLFDAPWVRAKSHIVPNGIRAYQTESEINFELGKCFPENYVLQVGRLEPIKGQLMVIQALMNEPVIPLVFVGKSSNEGYAKLCKDLGHRRGNTWFIEEVPYEQVKHYYERAKVHVLPSLRESPGLVTLEAAIYGANCVVSFHGPVAEYFGQDVWYCDPLDELSVGKAIMAAMEAPYNTNLRDRILNQFTWHEAAKRTLKAYQKLLGRK